MKFEEALKELKAGKKVQNTNWNGKGMYLEVQSPDAESKMRRPYIYINPGKGWEVPWTPSQMDLFSDGWEVIK